MWIKGRKTMDVNEVIKRVTEEVYAQYSNETRAECPSGGISPAAVASYIDHTILAAKATQDDVRRVCDEARQYRFASVCVNPGYIRFAAGQLSGSGVTPCCVVGFPLGQSTMESKAFEARDAVRNGAREVDMVMNVGAARGGDWVLVKQDIEAVVEAVRGNALVKVILETCLLTDEEKVKACTVAKLAGADFVKTSTGFSTGGATVDDVKLMRLAVGPNMGVKASGGIKTYQDAVAMIEAGASRLGVSSSIDVVTGAGAEHNCTHCGACEKKCPADRVATSTAY